MNDEDITKTTAYVKSLENIAEAANKLGEAEMACDHASATVRQLAEDMEQAEIALHEAINQHRQLLGRSPLPESQNAKRKRMNRETTAILEGLKIKKG